MVKVYDQYDPSLRESIKNQKTALIPIGSIEQHGPHLPISTDSEIVTEIAKQVSEKNNFLLLPTINYAVSFEHAPFFNLSVKNATLEKLLIDICFSLYANKITKIIIINGHHGNIKALNNFEKKISKLSKRKFDVFIFSYWHFTKHEFDHAGFVETSLMLTISNKVKMNLARKGFTTNGLSKHEKARLSNLASKSFHKVTKNGVWGDPTKSTKNDGKKILSEIVKNLVNVSQTCLTDKNRKLHQ